MILIQRTPIKDLENPMIFSKSKRDYKNVSQKLKALTFFSQRVFNFSLPKWELYIGNVPIGRCMNLALKINQKLNGKSFES